MKFLITLLFLGQAVIIAFIGTLITRAEAQQPPAPVATHSLASAFNLQK